MRVKIREGKENSQGMMRHFPLDMHSNLIERCTCILQIY
ncbi:hypothetical protein Gotur_034467, partial [Gossypium turneri]